MEGLGLAQKSKGFLCRLCEVHTAIDSFNRPHTRRPAQVGHPPIPWALRPPGLPNQVRSRSKECKIKGPTSLGGHTYDFKALISRVSYLLFYFITNLIC